MGFTDQLPDILLCGSLVFGSDGGALRSEPSFIREIGCRDDRLHILGFLFTRANRPIGLPDGYAMNGASAEVANDRFSTSAIVKMKAAPTRTTMSHSSNVGWRQVEDYLHRISMYRGNLQKSTGCNNNQDHKTGKQKYHKGRE
jgi:hypothetical protein